MRISYVYLMWAGINLTLAIALKNPASLIVMVAMIGLAVYFGKKERDARAP